MLQFYAIILFLMNIVYTLTIGILNNWKFVDILLMLSINFFFFTVFYTILKAIDGM